MKIAVGGKGGSGKTTVAGTLARVLADRGLKVVAVDDDSNPNLALTVGLPASAATGLPALPRDFLEERADAQGNKWLELAVPVEDFIDRFGVPAGENLTLYARDEETVREFAGRHALSLAAVIPYDQAVVEADERGTAPIAHRPDAPSITAIRHLADRLLTQAG